MKPCLVIAPIGEADSPVRKRSDKILRHVIVPVAANLGYEATRADQISEPGIVTMQIIQRLMDDPLVIADLTGRNANVFYELAVRHIFHKPVVQIIQLGEQLPFDVAPQRTIAFDHTDLDSVAACKQELAEQISAVEKDPTLVDSPISAAITVKELRGSGNPMEKSLAEILDRLDNIGGKLNSLSKTLPQPGLFYPPPGAIGVSGVTPYHADVSSDPSTQRYSFFAPDATREVSGVYFNLPVTPVEPKKRKKDEADK